MNEYRLLARYTIKDGVMYIPAWEWNTSERQILGLPILETLVTTKQNGSVFGDWLVLAFPNGWTIGARFVSAFDHRISVMVWGWDDDDKTVSYGADETTIVQTLDRLLGCIRTIAERPARKEVPNG